MELRLKTLKQAAIETGRTERYFRYLLERKQLKPYRIATALHISMYEFEKLATQPEKK